MSLLTKPDAPCAPWTETAEDVLNETRRRIRRVVADAQHSAEDATAAAALKIRHEPLKSVGLAALAGTLSGVLIGFAAGWYTKARR
jgi:ElaB/YqjD/DUF883 family membrane-anchored ribosome-binding protein